jgi:predicted  nucleic acid-binding Zn-ribbon protein
MIILMPPQPTTLDKTVRESGCTGEIFSLAINLQRPYNEREMSQPFKLFRLQQLDSHIDQAKARLGQIELILADDQELQRMRTEKDQALAILEAERKKLRRAEDEVKAQRLKIEQTEATLYGGKVRNPKELQDMQNEVAALKRYLIVLEDRQLESMFSVEEAESAHAQAAQMLTQVEQSSQKSNAALLSEKNNLSEEVRHLQDERLAASSGIPAEDLALYNQLRQQRRGVAVAKVVDKNCSACGSTLSSVLLHATRSPNQISRCDTCGRILYLG